MVDDIVRAGNTFKLVVDEEFGGHSGDPRSIFASLRAAVSKVESGVEELRGAKTPIRARDTGGAKGASSSECSPS